MVRREKVRPRSTIVTGRFSEPVKVTGFMVSRGEILLLDEGGNRLDPLKVAVQTQYERAKGPKVLNAAPSAVGRMPMSADAVLLDFDKVYAVDTNTRKVRGSAISATGVVFGMRDPPTSLRFGFEPQVAIEHRNVACDPERLGWYAVVKGIERNRDLDPVPRIGLIVDSHLGEIPRINDRESPLLGDELLPPRFTLVHASADTGTESILNKMIREADRAAASLLRHIEAHDEFGHESMPLPHAYAEYYRVWTPGEE